MSADYLTPEGWTERPMRWAQLALVENDPQEIDPAFWLDYFRRVHADGAVISAGGYVAYYPTQVPLHHRSAWLGDSDLFGELVAGCREQGMAVIARTDPHAIHRQAFEAHPDWAQVVEPGSGPRPHWAMPEAWVTCALGPYNFEFMTEVHREIVSRYRVDGVFSNRWAGHGICYCQHCQQNFRSAFGMELPIQPDPFDPRWRSYRLWRQSRLLELIRTWDEVIHQINPHACYIPNSGGGALSDLDMQQLGDMIPLLFADRQGRSGEMPPWTNGKNGKEYRAAFGRKPVGGMFSVGLEGPQRWKDSVQSEAELRIWAAEGIANGMRPWFVKFCGVVHDPRWLPVVEEIFSWHARHEPYLRHQTPLARIGLVYSQQTAALYGGRQAQNKVEDAILGVYQALLEARLPFEMVHDRLLDREHLSAFKTLVLPNLAVLSEAQCQQIHEFVLRGGSLVATLETSLYDEHGEQREDFGLADLFGVHASGALQGPLKNTYLNVEPGLYRQPVHSAVPFPEMPLTFVPPYPDLPMEEVYPRPAHTDIPEIYLRQFGAGRVIYFPWDIDRTFWQVLDPDHGKLLANAVRWATDEVPPVRVDGPGFLDVTVWRQPDSLTVHLVNLTNPMTMRGAYRQLYPVGPLEVHLRLPQDVRVEAARLLKANLVLQWNLAHGWLVAEVPRLLDHEVLAVDVSPR
jgi:hypothetical protein